MAEDTVDARRLGRLGPAEPSGCVHQGTSGSAARAGSPGRSPGPGPGTRPPPHARGPDRHRRTAAAVAAHLAGRYGTETPDVLAVADGRPELLEPLVAGPPLPRVEAVYAVRQEMAGSVADVLDRRTRASLRDARAAAGAAARVAELIGPRARAGTTAASPSEAEAYAGTVRAELAPGRARPGHRRAATRPAPPCRGPGDRGPDDRAHAGHPGRRRAPAGSTDHLGGRRVEVDDALRRRLADVCAEVSDDDGDRAEAGRDWWPLAIGWAAAGQVPARPAVVARPTDTAQVAAVLALCHQARVPVTPAGGRSGVCGASVPLFGGVALDLCGLAGIGDVDDHVAGGRPAGRHLRPRRGVGPAGRPRRDPRPLAPVDGPVDGGRLAGLPGGRPVLQPLREDRGHGPRPRGGAGRRPGGPHRRPRPAVGHRSRPDPAVRGQRGHPRGDHRGPVPGPPGARGRGPAGLRLRHLRRRARRLPADPAPGCHPGRPAPLRRHRVGAGPSTRPTPTCSSCWTRPTRRWSRPPWPSWTQECGGADRSDAGAGRAVARPPQRRVGPGPAVAGRHRGRHRRGVGPVGGPARPLPTPCSTPSAGWRAPWSPRPTSPTPTPTAPASTSPSPAARPTTVGRRSDGDPAAMGRRSTTAGPGTR